MIETYSFGGGTINDTMIHFGNSKLPFGGVGESGIGAYHGRLGFDTFSHKKGIVIKGNWLDIPLRYAPYTNKLNKLKRLGCKYCLVKTGHSIPRSLALIKGRTGGYSISYCLCI